MSVCRNCEEKTGGYCHGCMNNTVDRLTAQLAEREQFNKDLCSKLTCRDFEINTLERNLAERDVEIDKMRLQQLKAIGDLTNMLVEARKQAAQECLNIIRDDGCVQRISSIVGTIKSKFGLEG